ncbi:MAG TPA: serpin family protein [Streptosporangiaceae bacterium]|nr:serpin family protein [Streptosporangiaceae bacterium]
MTTTRRATALLALFAAAAVASGCGASDHHSDHGGASPAVPATLTSSQVSALRRYGVGDTAFGLNVLSQLCASQPGRNEALSPLSLESGLGMAYLGAKGTTAAAIAKVLHLPATGRNLASELRARAALLASLNRPGVTFTSSNRIWADPSLVTNPSFIAALRAGYQAGLTHLPLLSNPEQAITKINAAVAADTHGHIARLLPPGSIAPATIGWVLTDALYLNAAWKYPFDHGLTGPGTFHASTGKATAQYMTGQTFNVATAHGWTAVSLPYRGGRLSMLALLPPATGKPTAGSCQIPAAAGIEQLAKNVAASRFETDIELPKVKLASSQALNQVLSSLGMGIAFSSGANFSGLSPQACCIGFVRHAATLNVAEKGTVASAATGVGMMPLSARITLSFDRPYLMLLRDSLTGEPLMLAWVANPALG